MEINIYRANNNLYIDISGRVVLDVCEHLKNAAIPLIDKGINQVYVDLSAVDFVDSAGLGIMVGLKMTSNKSKARMVLVSPSSSVNDILFISKLNNIFDIISGSEAELLRKSLAIKEYLIQNICENEQAGRRAVQGVRPTPVKSAPQAEETVEKSPAVSVSTPSPMAEGAPVPPTPTPVPETPAGSASPQEPPVAASGRSAREQVDECCRKAVELMRQGDYEKAVEKYQEALHVDPDYLPAYNNLAIVFEKKPSWRSKAIEMWEKVLELSQAGGDQKHIDRAQKHLSNLKTNF